MWTRSKLGIVNLQHASQVYPWEPKPGVYEVRVVFPGGDTLTLSEHVSREGAMERVTQLLLRLGGKVETEPAASNRMKTGPFPGCHAYAVNMKSGERCGQCADCEQFAINASKGYPFRLCHGIHAPYSGACSYCQPPSPQDLAEMDAPEDKAPSFVRESHDGKLHFDDAADAAWRAKQAK